MTDHEQQSVEAVAKAIMMLRENGVPCAQVADGDF